MKRLDLSSCVAPVRGFVEGKRPGVGVTYWLSLLLLIPLQWLEPCGKVSADLPM